MSDVKFKEHLKNIGTYEPSKSIELVTSEYGLSAQDIIRFASNENPHGVSVRVSEKIKSFLGQMHRYPDSSCDKLREALAKKHEVKSSNIIIGSGSEQIIEFISRVLLEKNSRVLQNKITFPMYEICAKQEGAIIIKTNSVKHDLNEFKQLLFEHHPRLIYICTPSNPAGDAIDAEEVYGFLKLVDSSCLVVIDAAYMEYASFRDSKKRIEPKELLEKFSNVVYVGTFSKAYALGGMRVGYAIANEEIINIFSKVRSPFNIGILSLSAATLALEDEEFVEFCIKDCFLQMKRYEDFAIKNKIEFIESFANFITFVFEDKDSTKISEELLKKGVIVRDLKSQGLNAIRITIGTAQQNDIFFEIFSEVI